MLPVDRLGRRLRNDRPVRDRLLTVYLTVADPVTAGPPDLAPVIARAGADVLELGIPTPSTRPRGAEVAASFDRARVADLVEVWTRLRELRRTLPNTPLILLIYQETISDIGWPQLLHESAQAGVDGMVLTQPSDLDLARVAAAGLHAIPLIRPTVGSGERKRLEDLSSGLTYRNLAGRTGEALDADSAADLAGHLAADATKPFLVGFGIRYKREINALAPHVAGVVIGSEFLRLISRTRPDRRAARAAELVGGWKSATVLDAAR